MLHEEFCSDVDCQRHHFYRYFNNNVHEYYLLVESILAVGRIQAYNLLHHSLITNFIIKRKQPTIDILSIIYLS